MSFTSLLAEFNIHLEKRATLRTLHIIPETVQALFDQATEEVSGGGGVGYYW